MYFVSLPLRENVKSFLQLSKHLKIKPYLLSTEGSALANLVEKWGAINFQEQKGNHFLSIYLDFYESIVLFFEDGHLNHISTIDWGASSIVREMEKRYKLSFETARIQFSEKAFILTEQKGFTKDQIFFSSLIKKELSFLIHKLQLLKLSLETKKDLKIKEASLLGPGSVIKNISAFLSAELSFNVSRVKTLPSLPAVDFSEAKNHSFLVAWGLAMEGLKKPPYGGLNLLQAIYKKQFSLFPKKKDDSFGSYGFGSSVSLNLFFCEG